MFGSDKSRATAAGLAAAVLFGSSAPVAKSLLPSSGPFMVAGLLYLGAGLGLSALAPLLGAGAEARLRRADWTTLAGMIAAGGVVGPLLLLAGLARLSGSSASLLLNLEAPLTIALAVLFFGESISRRELAGSAAVLAGAVILGVPGEGGSTSAVGALAVSGACLAWAVDNNLAQRLSLRDPVAVARAKSLVAGSFNVALALLLGERLPVPAALAGILATGLAGYGVSIVLHLLAMRHLGAARQAAYFATAPFVGAVAAVPILGERFSGAVVAAGVLMLAGVAVLLRARHGHLHSHEALEHDHAHEHDIHHRDHSGAPEAGAHSHPHRHAPLTHDHPHQPDAHHRHRHGA